MRSLIVPVFMLGWVLGCHRTAANLRADGLCPLWVFLPFSGFSPCDDDLECSNIGFSQMASVLMAMEHFNTRNATVVPELAHLENCPVQFDFDQTIMIDTGFVSARHLASKNFAKHLREHQQKPPCAAIGPFTDKAAEELSTLATTFGFPLTVHRAFSLHVVSEIYSPYTTQVYPDLIESVSKVAELLLLKERTDYIAFVHGLTFLGTQWNEAFSAALDEYGLNHSQAFAYNSEESPAQSTERTMEHALRGVKQSGYRTIVVAAQIPEKEIPEMARIAVELGLTSGDYLWLFVGPAHPELWSSTDPEIAQLLRGSLHLLPYEYSIWDEDLPFFQAWRSQGREAVQRLRDFNPIPSDNPHFVYPRDEFFQTISPEFGSGFAYDAVMATGLGACRALAENINRNNSISGESFVKGIRASQFTGTSGYYEFGCPVCSLRNTRSPELTPWMLLNLLGGSVEVTELYMVDGEKIALYKNHSVRPFLEQIVLKETIYADGRTVPPDLLRDPTEQNYLSTPVRWCGLALMAIALLSSTGAIVWIYLYRTHRVLRASQPEFLYVLCLGSSVAVGTILPLSMDESSGWSQRQLSRACMSIPWLFSTGYILMYSSLFAKLWRINQVLQVSRRRIDAKQVARPCLVFVVAAIVILTVWSSVDPLVWRREETDSITGESFGSCHSDHMTLSLVLLGTVMVVPTLLTEWMAWKTRDIDEEYSESNWIFIMILVQCEVILFSAPMTALLRDVSTDARYLGFVFIIWTFPMSAVGLIIGPKYLAVRANHQLPPSGRRRMTVRGTTRGSVHVTGLSLSQTTKPAINASATSISSSRAAEPTINVSATSGTSNPSGQQDLPKVAE